MTKEQISKEIKECEERLAKLREELNKSEYGGKRWKPRKGDICYYICDGGYIFSFSCSEYDPLAKDLFAIGNCFRTEEEAKFELERRKVIAELSDFAEGDDAMWNGKTMHWFIFYNVCEKNISYEYCLKWKSEKLYFPSIETVKTAIEAVGEERIKKYYLGVM